jgi:hypothetical protein
MIQVHKIKKRVYSFESEEQLNKVLFLNNKVWMSQKEIAKLFNRKKTEINQIISQIFIESEYDICDHVLHNYNSALEKEVKYCSLDIILSIGYRFKAFEETKFIIKGNRILKEQQNNKKWKLSSFQKSIKNISKIIKSLQLG